MANKVIKSINLLPEIFRTDKNAKFLSSTIDQLIQPPQLERIDGYIGSTQTATYNSLTDVYITESLPLRRDYQLEPALVVKDNSSTVNDVIGIDDLTNEISTKGGKNDNFDRMFRSEVYSFDPQVDWDKLINYQEYYWLVTGPETIVVDATSIGNLEKAIVGQTNYTLTIGTVVSYASELPLSNGMKLRFRGNVTPSSYYEKEYFVEGVGGSIKLVSYDLLSGSQSIKTVFNDNFDANAFDDYPFDNFKTLPITPEYITINRASQDVNPWSKYNRWIHGDVIKISSEVNNQIPLYPANKRAQRPIVEFNANLKLFNFGEIGISNIDFIDTVTLDAFNKVEGSAGYYVDGTLLEQGNTIIFNADTDATVRNKIFQVNFVTVGGYPRIELVNIINVSDKVNVSINTGNQYAGTNWWFDSSKWQYAQQHPTLNQAPLFDLFDSNGNSYSDTAHYLTNFTGNKLFSYDIGTGANDSVLGFPLKYKNSAGLGSYLFKNYFMDGTFDISETNQNITTVPTADTYFKFINNSTYGNVWATSKPYPIPIIHGATSSYYELPLSLTNNPLNGPIASLTLSELSDHLQTALTRYRHLHGDYSGVLNLRDVFGVASYGTRLISNANPLAFANFFIGKKEHSVIDALTKSADQYNQFKLLFLKKISEIDTQTNPIGSLDRALKELNVDKDLLSPYYLSDMIAYGTDKTTRTWTVTDSRNTVYPITSDFSLSTLSLRSIIVYLNGGQLLRDHDYEFVTNDSSVRILKSLTKGDVLVVDDYFSTEGSFVPSTPTKLGLFPRFAPSIFEDNTYLTPVNVIQGHDGSLMVAYNDYRDAIILEFEKRVYNNIKTEYRSELLDVNSVMPGAFRTTDYSVDEINSILQSDFIKWAGFYGIDYTTNTVFEDSGILYDGINTAEFTWNYTGSYNAAHSTYVPGYWRGVSKYFYDTDKPHTHPWEMLGFAERPSWWVAEYGNAPYLSTNTKLWTDLSNGYNRHNNTTNSVYARPGLLGIIPVDRFGHLLPPPAHLVTDVTDYNTRQPWKFGDQGPAETSWRRSSYWPFVVQKLLALTKPAVYASSMYDTSRVIKNAAGQWTYGTAGEFLNITAVKIHDDVDKTQTSGYSVYVSEVGQQRSTNYIDQLKQDLSYIDFNLFYKVGGFVSKDKLQIVIDAYEPNSTSPGALLPQENYNLILNTSNPVKKVSISGLVVQKINDKYSIQGYDSSNPYFDIYMPVRNSNTPTITVGGVSESYVTWTSGSSSGATGLSSADTTSANSAPTGTFYQAGQLVSYNNNYYRVKTSHQSGTTFNLVYFQSIPTLPIIGGTTVQLASSFETEVKQIPYKTEFSTIQEVYDIIVGYGKWLEAQGFIFDEYNSDFATTIDWNFSSKEFLYWTSQNWSNNSIITVSPFANQIKYSLANTVVDSVFDSFYDYSLLSANGTSFPRQNLSVTRDNGVCTIKTSNSTDGIYFATIYSVQKEHAMVFNNTTIFNDTIYDIETGYRQRRMKLTGFRTANWNGDYFSPGFVYDSAQINDWLQYTDYQSGDVVRFNSQYYSANKNITGSAKFDFNLWTLLGNKPVAGLLPNFDYKINQFEDFYSLDIDNFDSGQQKMAQHLIGYTPRVYLNNIFTNPIAQYKFYQGFIKEKGTRNAITKLAKASIHNLQGQLGYSEEWAFRIGYYGAYETYQELEVPLTEGKFIENPQVVNFVNSAPSAPNDLIYYSAVTDQIIVPTDYNPLTTFPVETDTDFEFELITAGYVRIDDVTATAYNESSLLNLANNGTIKEGDTVWMGFKKNSDWDVYRYSRVDADIIGVDVVTYSGEITFKTNLFHGLSVGDIVSVSKFSSDADGIYTVIKTPSVSEFTVASPSISLTSLGVDPIPLYKFKSARTSSYDNLPTDDELLKFSDNTIFWVDNDDNYKWKVYQKINNFTPVISTGTNKNEQLGRSISKRKGSDIFVVGSPAYTATSIAIRGKVSVYKKTGDDFRGQLNYTLNDGTLHYYDVERAPITDFGHCVVYDDTAFSTTTYGLIFASAPLASYVSTTGSNYSNYVEQGLIKISSINPQILEENTQAVLTVPVSTSSYQHFGHSIYVQRNINTKLMLVGAPGTNNTGTGTVYAYQITTATNSINVAYVKQLTTSSVTTIGSKWGYSISGSDNANILAIGAPGHFTNTGLVSIFTGTSAVFSQTLVSPFGKYGQFGEKLLVSPNGAYLFVSAPYSKNDNLSYGKVAIYTATNGLFVLQSVLTNPAPGPGMYFGKDIDITVSNDSLVISAIGNNKNLYSTFDITNTESIFDVDSTMFYGTIKNSGTVYVYNRKDTRFVLADDLESTVIDDDTFYGTSVTIDDCILVGAPSLKNSNTVNAFYQFNKIDKSTNGFKILREQDSLTMVDAIQRVTLINSFTEEIINYLDVVDPLKGKIVGIADQELTYRTTFDPAVYSAGTTSTVIDSETNWLEDHVGELWWDLSTAKYVWYEQSDLTYRKNNWGKLFPGASIDVYEWVGSSYLPSEWSQLADTALGLTEGISGQPKVADDSVISSKQVYNSVTNSFSTRYYYWVKNKSTVPDVKNRRASSYQVASMIYNPTAYGVQYAAIIDTNAIALANIGSLLVGNRIHLNVAIDSTNKNIAESSTNRHTEWLLLQEGSATSRPNALLEKKLIDSLLGHDKLGNPVPNPTLTSRTRYGIGIRPQQTLFKDRLEALRNLVEFTNSVLLKNRITGNYSFANLNKQQLVSDINSHEYDQTVEDNEGLLIIDTRLFAIPKLRCVIDNGKIQTVIIDNPGFGYKISPTVKIISDVKSDAEISTEIDNQGRVISVKVVNAGNGFTEAPTLEVRPYTVIVLADTQFKNRWSKFIYDLDTLTWARVATQQYNTPLYWKYVDWVSTDYNPFLDFTATVNDVYEINELTLSAGQYVKIKNGGSGHYIILEKTALGIVGSFSTDYNIVYNENGTIQILDTIWDLPLSSYGFDQNNSYDQTLYDQTPDIELQYMLIALRDDIFVNELKVNWNLFFFKAVKYALSEQKLLDWAFKTSFINVVNYAGALDQRPVYKISSSDYYEQYLDEVKPYHTIVRSFTSNHTLVEPTNTFSTDFDNPYRWVNGNLVDYYQTDNFAVGDVDATTDYIKSLNLPKPQESFLLNRGFALDHISVSHPGTNYTSAPTVLVFNEYYQVIEDFRAIAHIESGKVISIEITNNTTSTFYRQPTVKLQGGTTGVVAIAYTHLTNKQVRTNQIGMKFDRVGSTDQIGNNIVVDQFVCNGSVEEFTLNWLADADKSKITITLDGNVVLRSDYTIKYFTAQYNGYTKKFSKVVFLNYVPLVSQVLKVIYTKSINLFNASERIQNYYKAASGMPGFDPENPEFDQLISGINYPKTIIEGLPFTNSAWDFLYGSGSTNTFDTVPYADDVGFYTTAVVTTTATIGSNTFILDSVTGIEAGQNVNIISTTSTVFKITNVLVSAVYALSSSIEVSDFSTTEIPKGYVIEFWKYEENSNLLDSAIDGNSSSPEVIINGDAFYTADTSHAPEEFLPGQASDSVGINVYTKTFYGAPVVFSHSIDIISNVTTRRKLGIVPPSNNNITVSFNGKMFSVSDFIPTELDSPFFYIDWEHNEIVVGPQSVSGYLGYTIISIGGGHIGRENGIIDSASATHLPGSSTIFGFETIAQVSSLASTSSVKSAYVTVNGSAITTITTALPYFELTFSNIENDRAAVNVYGLTPGTTSTIQAWFFGTQYDYFNEISEQTIALNTSAFTATCINIKSNEIDPIVAAPIVEYYNPNTKIRKQLTPPHIDYYQVTSSTNNVFLINNQGTFNTYDGTVRAYRNGNKLTPGFDYTVSDNLLTIDISRVALVSGDAIAIVDLPTGGDKDYDYDIYYDNAGIPKLQLSVSTSTGEIKVLTYNDNDDMMIRTERFDGNPNRRFKVTRPVTNINYVWVQLNGTPLTSGLDFDVLDDQLTIQISDAYSILSTDSIVIRSMVDQRLATTLLGYRIFNDMFNRTSFKRLSKENTTYLTSPLSYKDTEIHVADATVLTQPMLSKKIPGVVIIDGERIEFMKASKTVLSQLRRGTLGTAPSRYSAPGTKVIDQSVNQTIPFTETIKTQVHYTSNGVSTYSINTVTQKLTVTGTNEVLISDGIILNSIVNPEDQVQVFYGGRLLRKSGTYIHDTTITYDSPDTKGIKIGTTSTVAGLPYTTEIGKAYTVTSTNQVWVYTDSIEPDSFKGYVYRGLQYLPPEFTISNTQQLILNITGGVGDRIKLAVVKKEFDKSAEWNDVDPNNSRRTLSIIDSTTLPAKFLQEKTAELPDKYYYGGDITLTDNDGSPLLDDNNKPLTEGF